MVEVASLNMVELASLNNVELASLNMVELVSLNMLLTGLFMHLGIDCSWLDEQTDLNNVVGTIMIN